MKRPSTWRLRFLTSSRSHRIVSFVVPPPQFRISLGEMRSELSNHVLRRDGIFPQPHPSLSSVMLPNFHELLREVRRLARFLCGTITRSEKILRESRFLTKARILTSCDRLKLSYGAVRTPCASPTAPPCSFSRVLLYSQSILAPIRE